MGNLEPLPPSAIQQQPGATVPTQRHGSVRSTSQPQLPQQPLPETALQQTNVRLPQQPVSSVVTRLTQTSGSTSAARIVQLPTQPIPQNTVGPTFLTYRLLPERTVMIKSFDSYEVYFTNMSSFH